MVTPLLKRLRLARLLASVLAVCAWAAAGASQARTEPGWRVDTDRYSARISQGEFRYYSGRSDSPDLTYSLTNVKIGRQYAQLRPRPKLTIEARGVCADYGIVSESYTAHQNGIRQCWVVQSRPKSSGGIAIEGEIRSPLRPVRVSGGWEFVDRRAQAAFSYGAVTVIDSAGRTYRCLPSIRGTRLTVRIPEAYVKHARFPILVDPVVGPETPICPTFGPAPGNQEYADIAASPHGYLAVWQDARGTQGTDIFGCRIDSNGQPLDLFGIAISTATSDQTDPAVAWTGQEYLVAWADRRGPNPHIYAARVRPNGEVIDKDGMLISGDKGVQAYPRVASDGTASLIVWQDARASSSDVYGCMVSRDGVIGRVYGISTRLDNEEQPDVAWNGSNFTVAWTDYRNIASSNSDIYSCRVSRNGIRMAGDTLISCDSSGVSGVPEIQRYARVCSFGSACMVVWEDFRNDPEDSDLYGARVSAAGTVYDRNGIRISGAVGNQELASVGFNGTNLLAVWRERSTRLVRGARITPEGALLDPSGIAVSLGMAGFGGTAVGGKDGRFMVAWNNISITASDAIGTIVFNNGGVKTPAGEVLSLSLDRQQDYCVVDNGSDYVVVWSQLVNGRYNILATWVSYAGTPFYTTPVDITGRYPGDQLQPSIAWNGSEYLLAWCGNESLPASGWDIRGCLLAPDLSPIGQAPISICSAQQDQERPCVASNGSGFLVAWEDSRTAVSPNYYTDLYGAVVSSGGTVTPTTPALSNATGDQRRPSVASDGSSYFVVWEDYASGSPLLRGCRVTSAGQALTSVGLPPTSYYQTKPHICFGGGNYFAVWSDYYAITGCRISASGTVLDQGGLTIDSGTAVRSSPSACWDGSKYQVVWEDYRSSYAGNSDIYYTYVGANGAVSPEPEAALVTDLYPQLKPRICSHSSFGTLFYSNYFNYADRVTAVQVTEQGVQYVDSIAQAKQLSAGTSIALGGKVVTASFPDYFYIEEPDRSSGIKIVSDVQVEVDDVVDVAGVIGACDGERQITPGTVAILGISGYPLGPLAMRVDCLGGAALNPYTPGITGAFGVNNIGLLVKTWGKVTAVGKDYFYVQDRPPIKVKVKSGSLLKPAVGDYVAVTGISSCEIVAGGMLRVLLPRTQADIQQVQ